MNSRYKKLDIYFTRSHSKFTLLGILIRLFMWAKFSHVALGFKDGETNRSIICEAETEGVSILSKSNWSKSNKIIEHYEILVNHKNLKRVKEIALAEAGKPYDFGSLFGFLFVKFIEKLGYKTLNPGATGTKAFFCSEFVGFILEDIFGSDFVKEDLETLDPKDLRNILRDKESLYIKKVI